MVTIRQFQSINRIKSQGHPPLTEEMFIVGILNGLTEEQVRELSIDNYRELSKKLSYIDLSAPDLLIPEFTHEGIKYKVDTMFKLSSQFIDFDSLRSDVINNLHLILALFAYEGNIYTEDAKERAEKFLDSDFKIAYSVAFFFSRLMMESLRSIEIYSKGKAGDGMKRNGVGKLHWTELLMETAQNGTSI